MLMRTRRHKRNQRWKMEEVEAMCCSHKQLETSALLKAEVRGARLHRHTGRKERLKSWLIIHADPCWDWSVISAVKRRSWRLDQNLINRSQQNQSQAAASRPDELCGTSRTKESSLIEADWRWLVKMSAVFLESGVCPVSCCQIEELTDQMRKEVWTFTQHLTHLSVKAEGGKLTWYPTSPSLSLS